MHAFLSASDSVVKYFEAMCPDKPLSSDQMFYAGNWMAITRTYGAQMAQSVFEDIEAMRGFLTRGGRPLPLLPADFHLDTLLESLESHNSELVTLQTVLEIMDDDAAAKTLLADIWQYYAVTTKRDLALLD